tara:strand:- start:32643 stop:32846 length:204 start_codon:yes stop_codon:yes gene_type:complete
VFRYGWEKGMSWKDVLKYCEYHRNPPEPIPAKEEEKMAGAVTTASAPAMFNQKAIRRKKKKEDEEYA